MVKKKYIDEYVGEKVEVELWIVFVKDGRKGVVYGLSEFIMFIVVKNLKRVI